MEIVRDVLLILHFIGLASLLGGFMVQMSATEKVVNPAMLHGALTQLVTGIGLLGTAHALGYANDIKATVKLALLLVIMALVFRFRGRGTVPVPVWGAIGGLTVVVIALAVLWRG